MDDEGLVLGRERNFCLRPWFPDWLRDSCGLSGDVRNVHVSNGWLVLQAGHFLPSRSEIKNGWSSVSTSPYTYMVCC